MKMKKSLLVAIVHMLVLAGFSLLQGCASGDSPVCWLNWPYNTPADEPLMISIDEDEQIDYMADDSLFLPPEISVSDPVVIELPEEPMVDDQVYVVKKGDTLSAIASMYGTSWRKLSDYNGLSNPNKLLVNQEIRIPGNLSASSKVVRPSSSSSSSSSVKSSRGPIAQGSSYVIERGDTLSGIAKRAGLSVAEIKAANALDNNMIVAGRSLSIPKSGEVSTPITTSFSAPAPQVVDVPQNEEPMPEMTPAPLADIAPVETAPSAPVYEHVLYPGETLEDVARQYGSSQDEIMMLNGLDSPDNVKPGTKLLVPIPE